MARKDLSRTVIEGGRYWGNSYQRRASHGAERARTRAWMDAVRADTETAEERVPRPRPRVRKNFRDKLGPARRWLERQVGRPWNAVFSELCATFDTRTVAGRHVVYGHLLPWVHRAARTDAFWEERDFVVDAYGILRRGKWYGRSFHRLRQKTRAWTLGRRAALTHRGWWWGRPVPTGPVCARPWQCSHARHHEIDGRSYHEHHVVLVASGPLTRGDRRRLDALPSELRDAIVIAADRIRWR